MEDPRTFTDKELAKLPKWAQAKAVRIERDRNQWRDRARRQEADAFEHPAVFVWEVAAHGTGDELRPVGDEDATVYFVYGRPGSMDRFDVHLDRDGTLAVRSPGGRLAIKPNVSNSITVEAVDRT